MSRYPVRDGFMRIIGIVLARLDSKRLRAKALKDMLGRLRHAVHQAQR
jgi:spore coat polysaccharide biosynthesis protein SpsF (cytidylyltransferase family)